MGGNAMKKYNVKRLNRNEYDELTAYLNETFKDLDKGNNEFFAVVKAYRQKQDFGDCDVLTTISEEYFLRKIKNDIKILSRQRNGNVISYAIQFKDFSPFQLDLIKTNPSDFNFNLDFLSYNGLGALIGTLANSFGFKLSYNGLYLKAWYTNVGKEVKKDEKVTYKKEALVFNDFDKALEFLGFDSKRYRLGFDTLDDIFSFIATSKYFAQGHFSLQYQTNRQRKGNEKLSIYELALKYFNKHSEYVSWHSAKYRFKQAIIEKMPRLITLKRKMKKECKREFIISRRLKAKRIITLAKREFDIELQGKTLGLVMMFIKGNIEINLLADGLSNRILKERLISLMTTVINTVDFQREYDEQQLQKNK